MTRAIWRGPQARRLAKEGAERGLRLAGEHLKAESQKQVPHREGILEASAAVHQTEPLEVAVSYDTPYAVIQHEELSFHHPHGRKAKYLEDPLMSETDTFKKLIATSIERNLK